MQKYYLLFFGVCILFLACKNDDSEKKQATVTIKKTNIDNLNISLLLDLSDRIDPKKHPNKSMQYFQRDAGYIQAVYKAYSNHIRSKRLIQVNDKIQLFFDPEPHDSQINDIAKNLKIHFTKNNLSKDLLAKTNDIYSKNPQKLYQLAIADGKKNGYPGSKTWGFFKNKIKDNCIEKGYRNIIIIITDGYIYHEDSKIKEGNRTSYLTPKVIQNNRLSNAQWEETMKKGNYGFLSIPTDLSNMEVLILGINPSSGNPYELDVIKKYWSNWLNDMNVKKYDLKEADLPSNMDKIISDFIASSPNQ